MDLTAYRILTDCDITANRSSTSIIAISNTIIISGDAVSCVPVDHVAGHHFVIDLKIKSKYYLDTYFIINSEIGSCRQRLWLVDGRF